MGWPIPTNSEERAYLRMISNQNPSLAQREPAVPASEALHTMTRNFGSQNSD